jgi:hypothetical protein
MNCIPAMASMPKAKRRRPIKTSVKVKPACKGGWGVFWTEAAGRLN